MEIGVFDISIAELCLAGVLVLAFAYEVYFYIRYMWMRDKDRCTDCVHDKPGVTVIVCAKNEANNLRYYVQSLLTQDYPEYEVILVNDGSEDSTQAVIDEYVNSSTRVRSTFVPRDARMKSTKKLGLTLAAKAATYDYLLLTDADCRPESKHWISAMMEGFESGEQIEIVLGYGGYFAEESVLNDVIQYDTLFNGLHYMGAAMAGKPYMGVGRNLAYRKSTFFEHGGFSDQMTERSGDDDLFVNKVATAANTAVVNTRDSITWSIPKRTWHAWWLQKRRHVSVAPAYKPATKHHLTHEPITRGVFYGVAIALFVLGEPLTMCLALGLLLIRLLVQLIVLNRGARRLGQPTYGLEVIWMDIALPLITASAMIGKKRGW